MHFDRQHGQRVPKIVIRVKGGIARVWLCAWIAGLLPEIDPLLYTCKGAGSIGNRLIGSKVNWIAEDILGGGIGQ